MRAREAFDRALAMVTLAKLRPPMPSERELDFFSKWPLFTRAPGQRMGPPATPRAIQIVRGAHTLHMK